MRLGHAALLVAALTGCSKRGCAHLADHAPERAVADVDEIALDVHPASSNGPGRVWFPLGKVEKDALCPRLSDAATLTWNGAAGTFRKRGGTTTNKALDTLCAPADADVPGAKLTPLTKIALADASGRVEIALPIGEARLESPSVRASGESTKVVVSIVGLDGTIEAPSAMIATDGQLAESYLPPQEIIVEGHRMQLTVPTNWLTAPSHRVVVRATLRPNAACVPVRAVCKATVAFGAELRLEVTR